MGRPMGLYMGRPMGRPMGSPLGPPVHGALYPFIPLHGLAHGPASMARPMGRLLGPGPWAGSLGPAHGPGTIFVNAIFVNPW